MMLLGYGMARKNIIDDKVSKALSWMIVNIANPAMILSGSQGGIIEKQAFQFTLVLSVIMFLVLILLAEVLVPLFQIEKGQRGIYKVMLVFSNMGFMGFPLIAQLFGSGALLYASVFLLPFDVLIYTYGVLCMSGEKMNIREICRKCMNIGLIAAIVSIVFAICRVTLPEIVTQTVDMLSDITAPLCMFVIGASFVHISWKDLFCDWKLMIFSVVKLVVIPVIGMMVIRRLTENVMLHGVSFVVLAAPSASMAAMLAQQYDGDYLTASRGIALTTLLSVLTMPLLSMWILS